MKSFINVLLLLLLALFITADLSATTHAATDEMGDGADEQVSDLQDLKLASLRGAGRLLSRKFMPNFQATMRCDKYPRVCRGKGSPGRECCRRKCVNVKTDRNNCGRCGKKCKYSEICCKGKCVNPMFSKKHCGGCNSKCNRGGLCVYGMCGYA